MQPQNLQLPRVAGSPLPDASLEQPMVAGLVFQPRPGRVRADATPQALARFGRRLRLSVSYAMTSDENRARIRSERRLQEANGALGSLLEKSAAVRQGARQGARLRSGLERLHRAVAAHGWNAPPERVLQSVARAHIGRLDTHALFILRSGLLKTDPNDRECLLAGVRKPDERTRARQTLQTLRQAVDDTCARHAVQNPLEALLQMPGIAGPSAPTQVMQVDVQLGRMCDRMNLLLDTSKPVRADIAGDDAPHALRARFLEPSARALKNNDLFRLRSLLDTYAAVSQTCGSPAGAHENTRRASFADHRPALPAPPSQRASQFEADDVPYEFAPGFSDESDGEHYEQVDDHVYQLPPESTYLRARNHWAVNRAGELAHRVARSSITSLYTPGASGAVGARRSRLLSRSSSMAPSVAASYAPGAQESVDNANTARALKAVVDAELTARGLDA
jgi:hypothetical protein